MAHLPGNMPRSLFPAHALERHAHHLTRNLATTNEPTQSAQTMISIVWALGMFISFFDY
jgi:hypothetical protein